MFVLGEAGVGKTRLARAGAETAQARGFKVLWGRCMRFGAVESVLLPWVVALEGWWETSPPEERRRVLAAVPAASQLLPSLGGSAQADSSRLLSVAESLLARIVSFRPVLLVIDDVQWADPTSRDALSYLIAGFGRQDLVVLATCRDEGLRAGDPFFGWTADLRRMPRVTELVLSRLGRDETEEQLRELLGGPPAPSLVDAVQQRTQGNPYLSELLAQRLTTEDESLPAGLPADLTTALLAAWHRLGPVTREVLRVLAVAGRPVAPDQLVAACVTAGQPAAAARRGLSEVVASGTVVPTAQEVWLRHPLLAEVLHDTYLPGEVAPVHQIWADRLRAAPPSDQAADELRRLGDLALHSEWGGDPDASFEASLAAADVARAHRLWREEPVHLQRAARLWARVRPESRGGQDESALLERAAVASSRVGQDVEAAALGRRALELAQAAGDRRRTSRLLIRCQDAAWWLGEIEAEPFAAYERAIALVRDRPDSPEYAEALAALAESLAWEGRTTAAGPIADQAVAAARRCGVPAALAVALGARSYARGHQPTSEADSSEGLRQAIASGDPDRIQWGAQWRINALVGSGRLREANDVGEWALATALDKGALGAALWHSSGVARLLTDAGRLRDAGSVVRTGLSLPGVGNGAAALRLSAALLAIRRGDPDAARLHVRRAVEQVATLALRPGLEAPPVLAELALAQGRPHEALELVISTLSAHSIDARAIDGMTVWGIRAAADLVQHSRDVGDRAEARQARVLLRRLVHTRDRLPGEPFTGHLPDDRVLAALRAFRDAEVARFDGTPDPALWQAAVHRCQAAALGWEAQVANLMWGAALLAADAPRTTAAVPLRTAHRYACTQGAQGLRRDVEALAAAARVPLAEPEPAPAARRPGGRGPLDGLTGRESEVLAHLVSGRTYAEIARSLFISEKTVSTHVSHVLTKTGTSSRREVAALALRLEGAVR